MALFWFENERRASELMSRSGSLKLSRRFFVKAKETDSGDGTMIDAVMMVVMMMTKVGDGDCGDRRRKEAFSFIFLISFLSVSSTQEV